MSVNDKPRDSFNGMSKSDIPPFAPAPEYSGPGNSDTGYPYTAAPSIATAENVQDLNMCKDAMAWSWAQDIVRCQYCEEEPAQFHCVPCGDELCPRCKTFHLKSKVPSGHSVIPISERLEPTNMIKMCETHSSRPYDACCEDCQVPVCIICIQEIHNKHGIGKMQDMYEKQKAEALKELSEMKTEKKASVIQKIKDVENRESKIKSNHENMRIAMQRQAKSFKDHIDTILTKGLNESDSDEKSKLKELSQHKVELEDYHRKVEQVIDKIENLTESCHPADLILYRKQNPDVVKQLKCPDTVVTTDPTFTAGKLDQRKNEKQFGKITSIYATRVRERHEGIDIREKIPSAIRGIDQGVIVPNVQTVIGPNVETVTVARVYGAKAIPENVETVGYPNVYAVKAISEDVDTVGYPNVYAPKAIPQEVDTLGYPKVYAPKAIPQEVDTVGDPQVYTAKAIPRKLETVGYPNKEIPQIHQKGDTVGYPNVYAPKAIPQEVDTLGYPKVYAPKAIPQEVDTVGDPQVYTAKATPRKVETVGYPNKEIPQIPQKVDTVGYPNVPVYAGKLNSSRLSFKQLPKTHWYDNSFEK